VIVDYVCRLKRGRLKPGSDVVDARWVRPEEMPQYHLTEMATKVILKSFEVMKRRQRRIARAAIAPETGAGKSKSFPRKRESSG
jgi:23S rRNA-/tRNA-specific pseudouridylate synthase